MTMNGLLLIDKPKGWTSHDVVAKIRRILATESRSKNRELRIIPNSQFPIHNSGRLKVGHTGTLDPAATGLLILVVGSYTKRAGEFSKLDKTYEAELQLGATSSTGDSEGTITPFGLEKPSEAAVKRVLESFVGEISQTPPAYSAVKINGQRAYKLARQGKEVKIKPRKVKVYSVQLTAYSYPKLSFTSRVSSGTYIRSLAEDIGQKLGTGAYLSDLRRTSVGEYSLKNAKPLDKVTVRAIMEVQ